MEGGSVEFSGLSCKIGGFILENTIRDNKYAFVDQNSLKSNVDSSDVGNNRENLVQVHICATACKRT
jgi:hypothetical protein